LKLRDIDFIEASDSPSSAPTNDSEFGFSFDSEFLTEEEMQELLKNIELGPWLKDKESKLVQIFGYNYLDQSAPVEIPQYFDKLRKKIQDRGFGTYDQLIISEFLPGTGIKPHVDRFYWAESIVGISFLSSCVLKFQAICRDEERIVTLNPGSFYQLRGASRFQFTHSIPLESVTERRISLTFRNLASEKVVMPQEAISFLKIKS